MKNPKITTLAGMTAAMCVTLPLSTSVAFACDRSNDSQVNQIPHSLVKVASTQWHQGADKFNKAAHHVEGLKHHFMTGGMDKMMKSGWSDPSQGKTCTKTGDNQGQSTSTQTTGTTTSTGNPVSVSGQGDSKGTSPVGVSTTPSTSTAQTEQLKSELQKALQSLHQEQAAEKTAHQALTKAAKDYVSALRSAVTAGDMTDLQNSTTQAQSIIKSLQGTLNVQKGMNKDTSKLKGLDEDSHLQNAITMINNLSSKETTKVNAMNTAAAALEQDAQTLQQEVNNYSSQASSTPSATTTPATSAVTN